MSNMETINTSEKINRMQTLKAMERLMITLGGKEGLMAWLGAMPNGVALSPSGGVTTEELMTIAGQQETYDRIVLAFAKFMGPRLQGMTEVVW